MYVIRLLSIVVILLFLLSCNNASYKSEPLSKEDNNQIIELVNRYMQASYSGACEDAFQLLKENAELIKDKTEYCISIKNNAEFLPDQISNYINITDPIIAKDKNKQMWFVKFRMLDVEKITSGVLLKLRDADFAKGPHHISELVKNKMLKVIKNKDLDPYLTKKSVTVSWTKNGWKINIDWKGVKLLKKMWKNYSELNELLDNRDGLCVNNKPNIDQLKLYDSKINKAITELNNVNVRDFDTNYHKQQFNMLSEKYKNIIKTLKAITDSSNICNEPSGMNYR